MMKHCLAQEKQSASFYLQFLDDSEFKSSELMKHCTAQEKQSVSLYLQLLDSLLCTLLEQQLLPYIT
jgi:hypothetical protein